MYLVKSPLWLKWFYPTLLWNKSRSEKVVYLTFDDGPIPNVTTFVLNTLKTFHAKATFFCIGDNIRKHPDIFHAIQQDGHSIGNHTFNHLNGWKTTTEEYLNNILQCQEYTRSPLFRPPYGRIRKAQIRALNNLVHSSLSIHPAAPTQIVMWDVLSGDFDERLSPEKCYQQVIRHTRNGAIIVFHDSEKAFKRLHYTLPRALDYLQKKGYRFDTL